MSTKDNKMTQLKTMVSYYHKDKLEKIAKIRKISVARLIAIAIDNELNNDESFKFDTSFPGDEYVPYTYADEAGKLLKFMKTLRFGAGLDVLVLLRYDIGIPNKQVFLAAFRECLELNMIESFKRPKGKRNIKIYDPDYLYYRVKSEKGYETRIKRKHRVKEYDQYQKLKKKFEGE